MLTDKQRTAVFALPPGPRYRRGYVIATNVNGRPGAYVQASGNNDVAGWVSDAGEASVFHSERAAKVFVDRTLEGNFLICKHAGY